MKVSLDKIVWNPFRDMELYPLNDEHVAELVGSIKEHEFFGGLKARRRNGVFEIGCGHHRIAAARKAKLDAVDIVVDDIDDDAMIRLMADENATQSGAHPGAILNETAAVIRRVAEMLMQPRDVEISTSLGCYFDKGQLAVARNRLISDTERDAIGWLTVLRFLGHGDEAKSRRKKQQIVDAISTLKQSGAYDNIIEQTVRKFPSVTDARSASKEVVAKPNRPKRRRTIDERCARLFNNDHQFRAFKEAVTTQAAQKVLPVSEQYNLAKQITTFRSKEFDLKHVGAPYIKKCVQAYVQDGLKKQRDIDKEERELYLFEQCEARIDDELRDFNKSLRSLFSSLLRMADLAKEFPGHPKVGGVSARLDELVDAIKQFGKAVA
jgi:hypothetical protein